MCDEYIGDMETALQEKTDKHTKQFKWGCMDVCIQFCTPPDLEHKTGNLHVFKGIDLYVRGAGLCLHVESLEWILYVESTLCLIDGIAIGVMLCNVLHLLDYLTFKAVRTVLGQLYEMNPTQYMWFYNFVVNNKPGDGKSFLRLLVKERQELAERVMVTRLHLFNKWVKVYSHVNMHQAINDQNLELMRERLVQTVKWPSDNDIDAGKSD
eukprot:Gb_02161 [translate_table: standard]